MARRLAFVCWDLGTARFDFSNLCNLVNKCCYMCDMTLGFKASLTKLCSLHEAVKQVSTVHSINVIRLI